MVTLAATAVLRLETARIINICSDEAFSIADPFLLWLFFNQGSNSLTTGSAGSERLLQQVLELPPSSGTSWEPNAPARHPEPHGQPRLRS